MSLVRPAPFGFLALLPFLAACDQTAAPPPNPGLVGSGAIAAINDLQATRARHRLTSTAINFAGGLDPTALSVRAIDMIEEEQDRIEVEKRQKVDEEVQKALAEAEAMLALSEKMERENARAGASTTSRRQATP